MSIDPSSFNIRRPSSAPEVEQSSLAVLVRALKRVLVDNPILDESTRALRKMLRTGRTALLISFILFGILYIWLGCICFTEDSDASIPICYIQLVIITLLIPGSIYSAISGEREHSTWDALLLTRLTTGQIVFGKLIWRLRMLLIVAFFCVVPILISRLGETNSSTTNEMVLSAQLTVFMWGVLLCTFGLWISAITKRSITSLAVITLCILGFLIALPTLYGLFSSTALSGGGDTANDPINGFLMTFNPFTCLPAILGTPGYEPQLAGGKSGVLQIVGYSVVSIVCTAATYVHLRVLEHPGNSRR